MKEFGDQVLRAQGFVLEEMLDEEKCRERLNTLSRLVTDDDIAYFSRTHSIEENKVHTWIELYQSREGMYQDRQALKFFEQHH